MASGWSSARRESRELVYDWSSSGKSRQLKDKIAAAIRSRSDVIPLLRKTLEDFQPEASATEIGTVLSYGDGIAEVSGLPGAEYGEILIFENGVRGMVLDLKEKKHRLRCFLRARPPYRRAASSSAAADPPESRSEMRFSAA